MLTKTTKVTTIQINYESGKTYTVDVIDYSLTDSGFTFTPFNPDALVPIALGTAIESIWRIAQRDEIEFLKQS